MDALHELEHEQTSLKKEVRVIVKLKVSWTTMITRIQLSPCTFALNLAFWLAVFFAHALACTRTRYLALSRAFTLALNSFSSSRVDLVVQQLITSVATCKQMNMVHIDTACLDSSNFTDVL